MPHRVFGQRAAKSPRRELNAYTIINCLEQALAASGAALRLGGIVRSIAKTPGGFALTLQTGEVLPCDRLLLATGGAPQGYELARSLGHQIEALVPSLFTFNVVDQRLDGLAGVAFTRAGLSLVCDGDTETFQRENPLLITHWGLSGPGVLKLSAFAARALHASGYQATVKVAFLPGTKTDDVAATLTTFKSSHPKKRRRWQCPGRRAPPILGTLGALGGRSGGRCLG